ncbi:DNA transformation protein [Veronia nyctiphanis]|uniref:DNA transformation protein n=1 Tax=Veronia nyctiphanis TaxID=1278244 RepID=A0A4Q0YTN2_9GAMM|nr:TfoX/Sxy family DNA transformation protein [Veronia nyctiphanis]RXJ74085.1 DNA transformation protein [Veronia nyctiphanis]
MDKSTLNNSIELMKDLGEMKSRSMFGGFGVFCDKIMFALVVNDKLHLRAGEENEKGFKELKLTPYIYKKRGFPVVTKYYSVPDHWWEDPSELLEQAKVALKLAKKAQTVKQNTGPERIKDLPNLRLATERMLRKAGIESVEELQNRGSLEAFLALRKSHSESLSLDVLWALEGALEGKHWSVITPQRKEELLQRLSD